jgi:hypothetical protein
MVRAIAAAGSAASSPPESNSKWPGHALDGNSDRFHSVGLAERGGVDPDRPEALLCSLEPNTSVRWHERHRLAAKSPTRSRQRVSHAASEVDPEALRRNSPRSPPPDRTGSGRTLPRSMPDRPLRSAHEAHAVALDLGPSAQHSPAVATILIGILQSADDSGSTPKYAAASTAMPCGAREVSPP